MATAAKTLAKPVKIVEVYSENCETEFQRICAALTRYRIISMDTEFPGVIFKSNVQTLDYNKKQTLFEYYQIMKKNIDALKLIQFNLSDFDVSKDLCAADSIELLKKQGINFEKNRREGIDSRVFARMLLQYGIVCNPAAAHFFYKYSLNWITFFRNKRLLGGLENVSKVLGAEREVGNCHQAGSDSLLTLKTFVKMTYDGALHDLIFPADMQIRKANANMYPYNCHLYINDFRVYSNLIREKYRLVLF
ncbi:hypothetical protein MKW92_008868 [Papaver armeniacum]|nr:hypothetical protein MKW92_008868 [Papaver armeniacum]